MKLVLALVAALALSSFTPAQAPPQQEKVYTVKISQAQKIYILQLLGKREFNESADLYLSLLAQCNAQDAPPPVADTTKKKK